jgi:hypothetical protein
MTLMNVSFFDDPGHAPKAREEVRINRLEARPYADGRRVAVRVELTPFLERPSLDIALTNVRGEPAGSLTVIEALQSELELTLHLRDREPAERYEIRAVLYYGSLDQPHQVVHTVVESFTTAPAQPVNGPI